MASHPTSWHKASDSSTSDRRDVSKESRHCTHAHVKSQSSIIVSRVDSSSWIRYLCSRYSVKKPFFLQRAIQPLPKHGRARKSSDSIELRSKPCVFILWGHMYDRDKDLVVHYRVSCELNKSSSFSNISQISQDSDLECEEDWV